MNHTEITYCNTIMEITNISVGKYTFKITDNILAAQGTIYSRNFKIGGKYPDCVNVCISYENNNPVSACIPFVMYDPECSNDAPLEHGQGSIIMIKTLLQHIYKTIPSIIEVGFEDKSNIECASVDEIEKKGSSIPLYYFSIAFNGETWYEKHFQARQKDVTKHREYRERISNLLDSDIKKETPFIRFLEIARPEQDVVNELEYLYARTTTYNEFFQSMVKKDRCRMVRSWISAFMVYYLKEVFQNTDWIIELPKITGGKHRQTRRKYYYPKGIIRRYTVGKDIGVRAEDV